MKTLPNEIEKIITEEIDHVVKGLKLQEAVKEAYLSKLLKAAFGHFISKKLQARAAKSQYEKNRIDPTPEIEEIKAAITQSESALDDIRTEKQMNDSKINTAEARLQKVQAHKDEYLKDIKDLEIKKKKLSSLPYTIKNRKLIRDIESDINRYQEAIDEIENKAIPPLEDTLRQLIQRKQTITKEESRISNMVKQANAQIEKIKSKDIADKRELDRKLDAIAKKRMNIPSR